MKRIFRALGAFTLSLTLTLSLFCGALAAETVSTSSEEEEVPSLGYLVQLDATAAISLASDSAQLNWVAAAAYEEMEELIPISEDLGLYKAADLSDIQCLVYGGYVSQVEPDYAVTLFDSHLVDTNPKDTYFTEGAQYNLRGAAGIQVQSAWAAGLSGEGVTVAVIDSGLNYSHLDVPANIARGRAFYYKEETNGRYTFTVDGVTKRYNYYGNSNTSALADDMGHGTMVAGIIAAKTGNSRAIAGIAPNATIIPIKCFTTEEGKLGGYVSNLISGINFAVENGADIINMSWGLRKRSSTLEQAITNAANAGCILVAAAGNDGSSTLQYPAAFSNVISVGATNSSGNVTDYSQRVAVDLCAPGSNIYSLSATDSKNAAIASGTSFSAPTVAAAIALLKESDPTLTQGDFLTLLNGACDTAGGSYTAYSGAGRLNLKKLLAKTGHAGIIRQANTDGSVSIQGSFYPQSGESAGESILILLCGYNAAGHLLQSVSALAQKDATYGTYRFTASLKDPNVVTLRAFFLSGSGSLQALSEEKVCSVSLR